MTAHANRRFGRTFGYDVRESALRSFLRWNGTLTSSVVGGLEFWLVVGMTFLSTVLIDLKYISIPGVLEDKDIASLMGPVLGLAFFTTVYYNGQAYNRYDQHYTNCMAVDSTIKRYVTEMLMDFGFDPALRKHILKATKYLLASTFYFHTASGTDNNKAPPELWEFLQRKGLLGVTEVDFLQKFPGEIILLLHFWAQSVTYNALTFQSVKEKYSHPERASMANRTHLYLATISEACMKLRHLQNLPIPFQYFHLMQATIFFSLLTAGFCCCLFASRANAPTWACAVLPFTVIAFVMLAMRQLAHELSDPFGHDPVDFPAADFMRHTYDHVVGMLQVDEHWDVVPTRTIEIRARHVMTPCDWQKHVLPEEAHSGPTDDRASLVNDGGRIWWKPENVHSAWQVSAWMRSFEKPESDDEVAAQVTMLTIPAEKLPLKPAVAPPSDKPSVAKPKLPRSSPSSPPPAAAAAAPDAETPAAVMMRVNRKLKGLAEALDRIPQAMVQVHNCCMGKAATFPLAKTSVPGGNGRRWPSGARSSSAASAAVAATTR